MKDIFEQDPHKHFSLPLNSVKEEWASSRVCCYLDSVEPFHSHSMPISYCQM